MDKISYPNLRLARLTGTLDLDTSWLESSRLVIDASALSEVKQKPQTVTVIVRDRRDDDRQVKLL